MPVFISHKKENKKEALLILYYLGSKGIKCYIDALDPELQTTDDITNILMKRVRECTHLMAVVSGYTKTSWWVPFEIGVASEIDRRITSYQLSEVSLPEFLTKWPILQNEKDLDTFIKFYKLDKTVPLYEGRDEKAFIETAERFHINLKSFLGQI